MTFREKAKRYLGFSVIRIIFIFVLSISLCSMIDVWVQGKEVSGIAVVASSIFLIIIVGCSSFISLIKASMIAEMP